MDLNDKKLCPFCGEEIKSIAVKCRYCNEWFDDRQSGQNSVSGSHSGSQPERSPGLPSGRHPISSSDTTYGNYQATTPGNTSLTSIHLVNHALGDRYEVLEEIGSGGMATVYKATQKSLKRPVALKVVHQNLLHDKEFVARFHREAQLCASLNHPGIIHIYDEGEASGLHFMAMEYLEGTDLHQLIRSRAKLTPEQTLQYILPVAEALHYAHCQGCIHRDIKSANIFITGNTGSPHFLPDGNNPHSEAPRVTLMDFGIAQAAAGTQLTRAGTVIGTPEYMSPEQAEGKKVDHRTDLYSLGVVMYECLTGKVPFKGDSAITTIYKVLHEQPNLQNLQQLPGDMKALIQQLLSKTPNQRPSSAKDIIAQVKIIQLQGERYNQPNREQHDAGGYIPSASPGRQGNDQGEPGTSGESMPGKSHQDTIYISEEKTLVDGSKAPKIITDPLGYEMVHVAGGEFTMGCTSEQGDECYDDERPAHRVSLSGYYIGKYPVTQIQWRQVMGNNPSHFSGCDQCPVENVSWNDVQEFIRQLNQRTGKAYKLPTEAQWEYAARGGPWSNGYKYAGSDNILEVAWYSHNSNRKTHSVGQKRANEIGVYDMSGNVSEWCEDLYGSYNKTGESNSTSFLSGSSRVLRGGSWSSNAHGCRVSDRLHNSSENCTFIIGFRLCHSVY